MTDHSGPSTLSGERLELLYQLTRTFNSSLDLDEVLNMVMDEVIRALEGERGFVMLRDDGEMRFRAARGLDHRTIEAPEFEISRGVVDAVAASGGPVVTSDALTDERFNARDSVLDLGLRSIMCTPLKVKGDLTGVLYIDNRLRAGIFLPDDLEFLNAIAGSAAIAIENARLYQESVEKGRMDRELQMAQRVQSSFIPETIPAEDGWGFAAYWEPAREVAGDYYDFIQLEDGRLGIVIADVTDKGMPAALFMALSRSILRACLDPAVAPMESIERANRLICADSTNAMPISLCYAALDPTTGELTYVNAGHNPPILYRAASGEFEELGRTGILLGVDADTPYEQATQTLENSDFLLLYTDGVTDAIDAKGHSFGLERFHHLVEEEKDKTAEALVSAIEKSLKSFTDQVPLYDDVTFVVARRE